MASNLDIQRHDRFLEDASGDMQHWVHLLAPTDRPTLIALSDDQVRALSRVYRWRYCGSEPLSKRDKRFVGQVYLQLKEAGKRRGGAFFARLGSRSPKDGILPTHRRDQTVFRMMQLLQQLHVSPDTVDFVFDKGQVRKVRGATNACLREFFAMQQSLLRLETPEEAMCLLLSSERVHTDLCRALQYLDTVNSASTETERSPLSVPLSMLCVRPWDHTISDAWEVRVFVSNNRVTCVSQYNPYFVLPEYAGTYCDAEHPDTGCDASLMRRRLVQSARRCVQRLQHDHSDDNYGVIDFANTVVDLCFRPFRGHRDDNTGIDTNHSSRCVTLEEYLLKDTCTFVELNPFNTRTGGALFRWSHDEQLMRGTGTEHLTPNGVLQEEIDGVYLRVRRDVGDPAVQVRLMQVMLEGMSPPSSNHQLKTSHSGSNDDVDMLRECMELPSACLIL